VELSSTLTSTQKEQKKK
jgi:Leucine-rich repeat (LRR) protein